MRWFYTDRQTHTHTDRLAQTGYLIVHRRKLFVGDKKARITRSHAPRVLWPLGKILKHSHFVISFRLQSKAGKCGKWAWFSIHFATFRIDSSWKGCPMSWSPIGISPSVLDRATGTETAGKPAKFTACVNTSASAVRSRFEEELNSDTQQRDVTIERFCFWTKRVEGLNSIVRPSYDRISNDKSYVKYWKTFECHGRRGRRWSQ